MKPLKLLVAANVSVLTCAVAAALAGPWAAAAFAAVWGVGVISLVAASEPEVRCRRSLIHSESLSTS